MNFDIAPYIDHTILKPDTTAAEIEKLCKEAIQYSFAAVCVPPCFVPIAHSLLKNTTVKTATVIGFPFGYNTTAAKLSEIEIAIADGTDELDMVHNTSQFKSGNFIYLEEELQACIDIAHKAGKQLKLIIETGLLTDEEIIQCCKIYNNTAVDFLKTSTGFAGGGGTVHAVKMMRSHLPERIAIKASGGIRNLAHAKELIAVGATRIGCSASVQIVNENKDQ
jgi:deoxyribose-phosphate aldolase